MLMKRYVAAFLCAAAGMASYAEAAKAESTGQTASEIAGQTILPADRNHWTATVAYDISIPGKWSFQDGSFKMFNNGSGVSFGADYLMLLRGNLFFEPGARIYIDNYRYNSLTIGAGTPDNPMITFDPPVRKTGMRIPLTVGYKFDVLKSGSVFFSTGPEPEIGFTARTKVDDHEKEVFEENMYKDLMRRFDLSWDIRGAIIINQFRIDITGAFGLLDMLKHDARMHEYRMSFGLGFVF